MATSKKIDKAQEALIAELKTAISEAETMLKDVADKSDAEAELIKDKVNSILQKAGESFNDIEQNVRAQGRQAIQKTEAYVQENPWQTVGLAGIAGLLLGVIIGRR